MRLPCQLGHTRCISPTDRFAFDPREPGATQAKDSALKHKELIGTLQITFVHNKTDLLQEVPAVPG
ncbi:MAG: hypothetical protein RMX65_028465 [Nostoc sp. DedQUE01]